MQAGTHRIRRQRWQVNVGSTARAFALRQALRGQLDTVLLPAFERAFNAIHAGDEVMHIPQLTLRLQVPDGEDLMTALARLIEEQLALILTPTTAAWPARLAARRLPPHVSRRQVLVEYVATGRVAWHVASLELADVLSLLRDEAHLLVADLQQTLQALGGPFAARSAASFRLLQLLDATPRAALLQRVADADVSRAPPMLAMLRRLVAVPRLSSYLQLRLAAILLALREDDLKPPLPVAVSALLRECAVLLAQLGIGKVDFDIGPAARLAATPSPAPRHVPRDDAAASAVAPADSPQTTDAGAAARADKSRIVDAGAVVQAKNLPTNAVGAAAQTGSPPMSMDEERADAADDGNKTLPAPAEGFLVNDAGLVLLHPFLSRLFHAVGIAPEGARLLDAVRLPRAAALLHWLATGRDEIFEFELGLIKVMLGLAPDDPLAVADGLLSDRDRAEADALLAAAIEHWPALGKTSVAGLRVSFLQRRGLLRDEERGWRLTVEPKSFDVLLGKLPWSISIMRLPWMTKLIFTDWPTP